MKTETITWHDVAEQLPDADLTVMLDSPEWDEVTFGWLDADEDGKPLWRNWDGYPVLVQVTRWADMPTGLRA